MMKTRFCSLAAILLAASPLHAATVIFSHTFDEAGTLNGTPVDVGTGAWVASGQFNADGSITGSPTSGGSATLAFSPANGLIYTLDARFTATAADPSNEWLGVGFALGQSTSAGTNFRFTNATVVGRAWMLFRGAENSAAGTNSSFLGLGTASGSGTSSGEPWADWTGGTSGTIDLRIILDTTGGNGNWTATWYAKRPADSSYVLVRSTADVLDENITSVGFTKSNTPVTGTLHGFSLTAIPEPSAVLLGGLGMIALLLRRLR